MVIVVVGMVKLWEGDLFYFFVWVVNVCVVLVDVIVYWDGVKEGVSVICLFDGVVLLYFWLSVINVICLVDIVVVDFVCFFFKWVEGIEVN